MPLRSKVARTGARLRHISLFSGVGGLEPEVPSDVLCELDPEARRVLARRFPESSLHDDVMTLRPPRADVVFGGWPCQDLSVAGLRRGLAGEKSGLFFRMVEIAELARAQTLIAENVPNLLALENGENFRLVISALQQAGFEHVAWRLLNAREFGLPHQRRRVFIVASHDRDVALRLFRDRPKVPKTRFVASPEAFGFYWTAGLQGINFSPGFSPTLKVGSSLSIASPPAVFFDELVRQISPAEALKLQGFPLAPFRGLPPRAVYRMMGNAVARPVGQFVARSVEATSTSLTDATLEPIVEQGDLFGDLSASRTAPQRWPTAGLAERGTYFKVFEPTTPPLCNSLDRLIDRSDRSVLSVRAASGLLSRLERSGKPCPQDLLHALVRAAESRP